MATFLFLLMKAHGILDQGPSWTRNLCIALVADRYFRKNSTVALLNADYQHQPPVVGLTPQSPEQEVNLIQIMSAKKQFSFVLSTNDSFDELAERRMVIDYFIIVGSPTMIFDCLRSVSLDRVASERSSFVIYIEIETKNAREVVNTVLEMLWQHQQQDVIVLVSSKQGDTDVYMWFPLDVRSEVAIVDKCNGHFFRLGEKLLILFLFGTPNIEIH